MHNISDKIMKIGRKIKVYQKALEFYKHALIGSGVIYFYRDDTKSISTGLEIDTVPTRLDVSLDGERDYIEGMA